MPGCVSCGEYLIGSRSRHGDFFFEKGEVSALSVRGAH